MLLLIIIFGTVIRRGRAIFGHGKQSDSARCLDAHYHYHTTPLRSPVVVVGQRNLNHVAQKEEATALEKYSRRRTAMPRYRRGLAAGGSTIRRLFD